MAYSLSGETQVQHDSTAIGATSLETHEMADLAVATAGLPPFERIVPGDGGALEAAVLAQAAVTDPRSNNIVVYASEDSPRTPAPSLTEPFVGQPELSFYGDDNSDDEGVSCLAAKSWSSSCDSNSDGLLAESEGDITSTPSRRSTLNVDATSTTTTSFNASMSPDSPYLHSSSPVSNDFRFANSQSGTFASTASDPPSAYASEYDFMEDIETLARPGSALSELEDGI